MFSKIGGTTDTRGGNAMKKGRLIILLLTLALVLCACSSPESKSEEKTSDNILTHYEGNGFSTPEEAVTYYMEGLKKQDFEQILRAFSWETLMEHYSVEAYYQESRSYYPIAGIRMPNNNQFISTANINQYRSTITRNIYRALECYILCDSPEITTLKSDEEIDAFLQKYDNDRLNKLSEMKDIRFYTPDYITSNAFSKNEKRFRADTAKFGADAVKEIVGVADIGDETLICCPVVARYGSKWFLVDTTSFTFVILGVRSDFYPFFSFPTEKLEEYGFQMVKK